MKSPPKLNSTFLVISSNHYSPLILHHNYYLFFVIEPDRKLNNKIGYHDFSAINKEKFSYLIDKI